MHRDSGGLKRAKRLQVILKIMQRLGLRPAQKSKADKECLRWAMKRGMTEELKNGKVLICLGHLGPSYNPSEPKGLILNRFLGRVLFQQRGGLVGRVFPKEL
jgi:hypothetical protein